MAAKRLGAFTLTLVLIAAGGGAAAHALPGPALFGMSRPPASQAYMEGEMLVKFKDGVTAEEIAAFNTQTGCTVIDVISGLGIYRLQLPEGVTVPEMVSRYEASELVAFAEPNRKVSIPPMPGQRPDHRPEPR